jgi:hypothetical protein
MGVLTGNTILDVIILIIIGIVVIMVVGWLLGWGSSPLRLTGTLGLLLAGLSSNSVFSSPQLLGSTTMPPLQ